jgi:hypothetical protein
VRNTQDVDILGTWKKNGKKAGKGAGKRTGIILDVILDDRPREP